MLFDCEYRYFKFYKIQPFEYLLILLKLSFLINIYSNFYIIPKLPAFKISLPNTWSKFFFKNPWHKKSHNYQSSSHWIKKSQSNGNNIAHLIPLKNSGETGKETTKKHFFACLLLNFFPLAMRVPSFYLVVALHAKRFIVPLWPSGKTAVQMAFFTIII